jgi:YD repeat-containing protein
MVNPASGDLAESDTLFSVPDIGFPLQFSLNYDARYAQNWTFEQTLNHENNPGDPIYAGPFGWGYTSESNANVVNYSDQYSTVTLPDGAAVNFNEGSTCLSLPGESVKTAPSSLEPFCAADRVNAEFGEYNNYGDYLLYEQGGKEIVTYNAIGQIIAEGSSEVPDDILFFPGTGVTGNGCTSVPSGTSGCTVVYDALGRAYTIPFAGDGIASEVQGPNGQAWTLGYDTNANLTSVSDPNNDKWKYGYDTTQPQPYMHDLNSLTDPDNNTTSIVYTPSGTNGGVVSSVTDGTTLNTTTYSGWNVASQSGGESYTTTVVHPDGQTDAYQYTAYQLGMTTTTANNGDSTYTEHTVYINNGTDTNPNETITDPANNSTTYSFDEVGDMNRTGNFGGSNPRREDRADAYQQAVPT